MKIDKGIPVAPIVTSKAKYMFHMMEVGDSIWTDNPTVRPSAKGYSDRHNVKFVSRKEVKDGVYGYRVWRVK